MAPAPRAPSGLARPGPALLDWGEVSKCDPAPVFPHRTEQNRTEHQLVQTADEPTSSRLGLEPECWGSPLCYQKKPVVVFPEPEPGNNEHLCPPVLIKEDIC